MTCLYLYSQDTLIDYRVLVFPEFEVSKRIIKDSMSLSLGASCCLESLIVITMVYFALQLHGYDNGFIPNANLAQNYGLRKH